MKLNRKLVLILSLVLSLALATGGTLAYLSDTDADVNTMTLGNVHIEQHEYQRKMGSNGEPVTDTIDGQESYVLEDFQQGKPLYPSAIPTNSENWDWDDTTVRMSQVDSYGGMQTFVAGSNAQDKFVTVENTGKSDAYVRTLIAIEIGKADAGLIGVSYHKTWERREVGVIEIEGNKYVLFEYTYKGGELNDGTWRHQNGVLPAGDTTYPNLAQVYLSSVATNEDVEKIDGNGNGMLDILVVSQAIQAAGFEDAKTALDTGFGVVSVESHPWMDGQDGDQEPDFELVETVEELQAALDAAADGAVIHLGGDITGDVTVTQKPNVKLTINGNGHTFAGVITVDGKSATYTTAGLTIQNVTFKADSISADACIRLGNGNNFTRYTCNVTVDNCTFDVPGAVGVKSYTGGDKNLTISDCTATSAAHSLVQAKGIDGILVEGCTVNSKNGLNFNNSDNVVVRGCTVNVKGYAVRFGESSGGVGAAETYRIENSSLTSANADGDATIILRGTADNSTLTIVNTTIVGTPDIATTATGATVVR